MECSNIHHVHKKNSLQEPRAENYIIHSRLNSFESYNRNTALSVKLVLSGTERYKLNDKRYDLSHGDFLLVDQNQKLDICFNELEVAEGMCFYFNRKYLDQFFSLSKYGDTWGLDNYQVNDNHYDLLSGKYKVNESSFGQYLEQTAKMVLNDNISIISDDIFLDMSCQLVQQQSSVLEDLNQLSSLKMVTRKELYLRALTAKHYIEDNVFTVIKIEELAAVSSLSEVQLYRTFKQIFKTTPYQYILTTKLNRAAELIRRKKHTISEVSDLLGFADLPTFSKAFKRKFGVSPIFFN